MEVICLQALLHFFEQQQVGQRHLAAKRVAKQFAAKLRQHIVEPLGGQVVSQSVDALDGRAVREPGFRVNRLGPKSPDGVVLLQHKAERVDEFVALGASGG